VPATITRVIPGSPAFRAGIKPGDVLCAINGQEINDVLDYHFHAYAARLNVTLGNRRVLVRKEEGRDPGLAFENFLMDKQRTCQNRCVFCFVDQQPSGLRPSLYEKDDDARMSFLTGSYITLTNLCESDADRICAQRISPLGISVHTTEPELRARMMGNPRAGELMAVMERFANSGIEMNCQIVLCPGYNDGEALDRTLADLLAFSPRVASVAVVPVGLTRHREGLPPLRPVTKKDALDALARIRQANAAYGGEIVYAADELILRAGLDPLDVVCGDEYPQLANGVGLMKLFREQWVAALDGCTVAAPVPFVIATGLAAAPFLRDLLAMRPVLCDTGEVIGVPNRFYGELVNVAGLLTGQDLLAYLKDRVQGRRVLLPDVMLRHEGDLFIDGMGVDELAEGLGVPVVAVPVDGAALLEAIVCHS
jgi:putative radical SAM enzyme (TIGR03279 family)